MVESKSKTFTTQLILWVSLGIFALISLIPLALAISITFSSGESVMQNGYQFIPKEWSVEAYTVLFKNFDGIWRAYGVSLFVTFFGLVSSLIVTVLIAYPLSVADFRYRGIVSFVVFFTMMFSGGTISYYIFTVKYLHLKNNIWVLVVTQILVPSNVFLLRTFFSSIPESIYESARLDGASEYKILFRMAAPLNVPGIITIGLFIVLQYWNDYITGMLFIDIQELYPLQLLLYRYSNYIKDLTYGTGSLPADESLLMAMCVIATVPMLIVFMFFQKYFVRGLTSGAVK
ncbi:MAG: carbohydrate ABC transporter permease [Clostridia bacterium]|nr:carbohydrate ABC transporter permease [Clostridia bacterium]